MQGVYAGWERSAIWWKLKLQPYTGTPNAAAPPATYPAKRYGPRVWCSFQARDRTIPVTGKIVGDTIQEQARQMP